MGHTAYSPVPRPVESGGFPHSPDFEKVLRGIPYSLSLFVARKNRSLNLLFSLFRS
jgi:hypothetical protein